MNEDIKAIVIGLIEKSKNNQVKWVHYNSTNLIGEDGPSSIADDYAVSTPNFSINIFKVNSPSEDSIRVNIYNAKGDLVIYESVEKSDEDYKLMFDLLQLAKKYVFGEDKLLKMIKDDLAKSGILGD